MTNLSSIYSLTILQVAQTMEALTPISSKV